MMRKLTLFAASLAMLAQVATLSAAESSDCKIWDEFVAAQKKGGEAKLLDFSFAGYHHAEKSIPDVDHKIFNVCDYGAVANDHKSDRAAVIAAIAAAEANGSGVIFFPKGRYKLHEAGEPNESIEIKSSNIVLRGEGCGIDGTEIFYTEPLRAPNPQELWTSPNLFNFTGRAFADRLTEVTADAARGAFSVKVADASNLKAGDWVTLRLSNSSREAINAELAPYDMLDYWNNLIIDGVQIYDYHQIVSVKKNVVTFKEPLMHAVEADFNWYLLAFPNIEEVGVEDIGFVGNWKDKFVHHKDDIHDGGWKFIEFRNVTNSWIRRCRFTDVSEMAAITTSANISVYDCTVTGNIGHNGVHALGSSRVFMGAINDKPAQWHTTGVAKHTMGTVIWRCRWTPNSCFESHASQPRATLFDVCEGSFMSGRQGGAHTNVPNHLDDMVMWNFNETGNKPLKDFNFWPLNQIYFKMKMPIIVGMHGAGSTFLAETVGYEESHGTPVTPESLFESQLKLRLGKLPAWLTELKAKIESEGYAGDIAENKVYTASNVAEVYQALEQAESGDTIELEDGDYKDLKLVITKSGSFYKPLTITAKNPGKAVISGDAKVELRGDHITITNLTFTNGDRKESEWRSHGPGLVAIYGDYCKVTESLFYEFDNIPSAYITTSVSEDGRVAKYAHIDRCAFIGKTTYDQVINLNNRVSNTNRYVAGEPMYHRVSYCYFSNPQKKGNAGGGIRVGYWRYDYGRCLIDNNVFERQDSEAEIITSKSMENVYYNNTFLNCQGTLNFRHGDKQVAINNFFVGTDDKYGYGGMYIWGSNHIIASNTFMLSKTLATRGNSALYFNAGPEASEHALAFDMTVMNNVFVGNNGTDLNFGIKHYDMRVKQFGEKEVLLPRDIRFVGNKFFNETIREKSLMNDPYKVAAKQEWVENLYNGMELGCELMFEGLERTTQASLRYDDSKVYVEDSAKTSMETIRQYLPYNSIEGIDLEFDKAIEHGVCNSALNRTQVGPKWCSMDLPAEYADTGVWSGKYKPQDK